MGKFPIDRESLTFHYRYGINEFPGWNRGIFTECDPGSNPLGTLRRAVNVRPMGSALRSRYGFTLLTPSVPAAAKVYHACNHNTQNPPVRIWMAFNSCFGVGAGIGSTVCVYDYAYGRQLFGGFTDAANFQVALGSYSGNVYIGAKSRLHRAGPFTDFNGKLISSGQNATTEPLYEWVGYTITFLQEFNGLLFIGLANDAVPAASKIATYDGKTILDDLAGIDIPKNACLWRSNLAVGFATTVGGFRWRDAAGTWTNVASAGLGVHNQANNSMCDLNGTLYFAAGNTNLYSYDGAAVATARTIAAADAANGTTAVVSWMGNLWYLWNELTGGQLKPRVGKWEPEYGALGWTDAYKTLTTDFANMRYGGSMNVYGDRLFVGSADTNGYGLVYSPVKYPGGTWSSYHSTSPTGITDIVSTIEVL